MTVRIGCSCHFEQLQTDVAGDSYLFTLLELHDKQAGKADFDPGRNGWSSMLRPVTPASLSGHAMSHRFIHKSIIAAAAMHYSHCSCLRAYFAGARISEVSNRSNYSFRPPTWPPLQGMWRYLQARPCCMLRHMPAWVQLPMLTPLTSCQPAFLALAWASIVVLATSVMPSSVGASGILGCVYTLACYPQKSGSLRAFLARLELFMSWTARPGCLIGTMCKTWLLDWDNECMPFASVQLHFGALGTFQLRDADTAVLLYQLFHGCAGLMFGPALLGCIADMTTVQVALQANALLLLATVAFFWWQARETRHLRPRQLTTSAL